MKYSNSSWDRKLSKQTVSPAFVLHRSRVEFEFENRKSNKIFQHSLGNVEFKDSVVNSNRDTLIADLYNEKIADDYKYPSISHAHILPILMTNELEVLAHGIPVKGGWENCAISGMTCLEGESDSKCEIGKCKIGKISRQDNTDRWTYESYSVPGLYYYVHGVESVELISVVRGFFTLPGGEQVVPVNRVASVACTVYLPPNTYSDESFVRRVLKFLSPQSVQDSLNIFLREVMGDDIFATVPVEQKTYDKIREAIVNSLPEVWAEFVFISLGGIWENRNGLTNRQFLIEAYSALGQLYDRGIQVMLSSFRASALYEDRDISRPVYGRLPGTSGGYNNDNNFDEDVSAWIVSGADMELSDSKTRLDHFYDNFLDPETCYPLNLDWIAQHLGFFGGLWDLQWSNETKRILIANAHKNELEEGELWTKSPDLDTLKSIDLSKIESLQGTSTQSRYFKKVYNINNNLVEYQPVSQLLADMSSWTGLIPSRGSLLSVLFMFWVFGIKSVSGEEMSIGSDGNYRVKSGLRRSEYDAPVNLPVISDVIHVGTVTDAEAGVYPNQLIADMAVCQDVNSANTVIIRMPFYYNRDGRTWDVASSIVENWMPSTAAKRIQYGYSAADLLVAEDVFYTP